jgi:hypothetical protein
MIDRASTPSEIEEGDSRGDMPKDGEVWGICFLNNWFVDL